MYDNILWVMKCASTTNIMIGKYEEALVYYKEDLDASKSIVAEVEKDKRKTLNGLLMYNTMYHYNLLY